MKAQNISIITVIKIIIKLPFTSLMLTGKKSLLSTELAVFLQ